MTWVASSKKNQDRAEACNAVSRALHQAGERILKRGGTPIRHYQKLRVIQEKAAFFWMCRTFYEEMK